MPGGDLVTPADAAAAALEALRDGPPVATVLVIEGGEGGPAPGTRMLVWAERRAGSLGDAELDARTAERAGAVLQGEERAGPWTVRTPEGECTLYVEAHRPPPELVIVGAGHIARPLCRIGAMLGFRVRVLDDRPEFATRERFPEAEEVRRADFADPFRGVPLGSETHLVLVTRGHRYDFEALRDVLGRPELPAYVGMVGSRRRVRAALEQLVREGIPRERLLRVHAPIGLDIGAETPEEIAVSIAAEIVRVRRGGTGAPLRDRERVMERWFRPAAQDASEQDDPGG
ncbi:MAG TPA: XdhC family protein [Longimicrobiaceae bacterium]|nr:XdhC family protein [Longimicrobiaceae bacterium]